MAKIDQFHQGEDGASANENSLQKKPSSGRIRLLAGILALGIGAVDNVAHAQNHEQSPSFAHLKAADLSAECPADDLDDLEQNRMQMAQEVCYRFYLHPGIWTYLKNKGLLAKVDSIMESVMRDPDALWYKEELGNIEIRRRPQIKSDIDPNLRIRIENGQITRINDIRIDPAFYAEWSVYEGVILDVISKVLKGRGVGVTLEDQQKFEAFSIVFPRRLQKLLELRNSKVIFSPREIPNSKSNKALVELSKKIKLSPTSLAEMRNPKSKKIQSVYTVTMEESGGVIQIRKNRAEGFGLIIGVSHEGYLMDYNPDTKNWSMPSDYKDAVKRQYQAKLAKKSGSRHQ
jgi:hypothetical protein